MSLSAHRRTVYFVLYFFYVTYVFSISPVEWQARLGGVEGKMAEVRRQYAREYRERRRLFNVVQARTTNRGSTKDIRTEYFCFGNPELHMHSCTEFLSLVIMLFSFFGMYRL